MYSAVLGLLAISEQTEERVLWKEFADSEKFAYRQTHYEKKPASAV